MEKTKILQIYLLVPKPHKIDQYHIGTTTTGTNKQKEVNK